MGDPLTAAEDPIFWLHHANVDRLWNRWIHQGGGRADPTDAAWLNTILTFYDEAGHAVYLTGVEVVDTVGQLNYRYDDDPVSQIDQIIRHDDHPAPRFSQIIAVSGGARITLAATLVRVRIPLTEATRGALRRTRDAGRKVFLRIDDIRCKKPPSFYYAIFLDPPAGQKLDSHTPGFVENLSLFSLVPHRMPGGKPMPGDVFVDHDISPLVDRILNRNANEVLVVMDPRGLVGPKGEPLPVAPETAGTMGSVRLIAH